jgi:hypothetical protein
MEAFAAFNTALLALGRLLLRNRGLGMAAIVSSPELPEEVKRAIAHAFSNGASNEDAILLLKQGDAEVVRGAGGILEWLQHSNVERQQRREAS